MPTRNCPRCGAELPDPVNVCTQCGKFLSRDRPVHPNETREISCLSLAAGGLVLSAGVYGTLKALKMLS